MFWFTQRDPQRFISKRFYKVLCNAVDHLERSPFHKLDQSNFDMKGNGVYAIYYNGFEPLYDFAACFDDRPIYVGKAVPRGWRAGRRDEADSSNLQKRLSEHVKSINQAHNLELYDFVYKYVILDGDLIASVEAEAIRRFEPIWNCAIEGFGNHNVGRNRLGQLKSEWDVLHSGRVWANRMTGSSQQEVVSRVRKKAWLFGSNK